MLAYGDIDGDGECETIVVGDSVLSGSRVPPIRVYKTADGKLQLIHNCLYYFGAGQWDVASHDGKAFIAHSNKTGYDENGYPVYDEPLEYEMFFNGEAITLLGAEEGLEFDFSGREAD